MLTKTYQAETMIDALHLIQQELGSDAIVVSAREVTVGGGKFGVRRKTGVEVVAMRESDLPEAQPVAAQEAGEKAALVLRASADGKRVEFIEERPQIEWAAELTPARKNEPEKPAQWKPRYLSRQEIETEAAVKKGNLDQAPGVVVEVKQKVKRITAKSAEERPAPPLPANLPDSLLKIRQRLLAQELDQGFIDRLTRLAIDSYSPAILQDPALCKKYFSELLEAELSVKAASILLGSKPVVCLIGPSGVGKTTMAARLAIYYNSRLGKKVTWVCADTVHTGAIAEAKAYTGAIGVPLQIVYVPADLRQILQDERGSGLVIIDTPGFNPLDESQLVQLGELLTEIPGRSTLLVASAATKESDLAQAAAALKVFHIDGLVITKLDETYTYGNVYNFSRKNQLPLTYFTYGKSASGSLQAADSSRLAAALFGKGWI